MSKYYQGVIYLTKCTHRRHKNLRYVGLDTKGPQGDPAYLGSSVVLKWWMARLGRQFFEKEILEEVEGTMTELCRIEQGYIEKFDAVNSTDFFNMNGQRQSAPAETHLINLLFDIRPINPVAQEYVSSVKEVLQNRFGGLYQDQLRLVSAVVSMCLYGYLRYEQEEFEYDVYATYYNCQAEEVQRVLNMLVAIQAVDVKGCMISPTDQLIDQMPEELMDSHFRCRIGD